LPTKRKRATLYRLTKIASVSGQFRYTQQETSRTAGLENSGVSGVSKVTPSLHSARAHYTNDLLSSDHFNTPGHGAELDTPDTPCPKNDANKSSQDADLSKGVSNNFRIISEYTDEKTGEKREVFAI
jgi:hypothetical protein